MRMTDQPPSDRFKTEMPQIPGVPVPPRAQPQRRIPPIKLVIDFSPCSRRLPGSAHRALRRARPAAVRRTAAVKSKSPLLRPIEYAAPACDCDGPRHRQHGRKWQAVVPQKILFSQSSLRRKYSRLLIRLPAGSPSQSNGYWAFSQKAPFGNCQLEYVTDLDKLKTDYGFRAARHIPWSETLQPHCV